MTPEGSQPAPKRIAAAALPNHAPNKTGENFIDGAPEICSIIALFQGAHNVFQAQRWHDACFGVRELAPAFCHAGFTDQCTGKPPHSIRRKIRTVSKTGPIR